MQPFAVVIALLAVAALGWLLSRAARRLLRRYGVPTDEREVPDVSRPLGERTAATKATPSVASDRPACTRVRLGRALPACRLRPVLTGVVVSLALGYSYRVTEVDDVLLNFAGILLGFGLYRMLRHSVASVTPA